MNNVFFYVSVYLQETFPNVTKGDSPAILNTSSACFMLLFINLFKLTFEVSFITSNWVLNNRFNFFSCEDRLELVQDQGFKYTSRQIL